jgi:hypothetical protein
MQNECKYGKIAYWLRLRDNYRYPSIWLRRTHGDEASELADIGFFALEITISGIATQ